MTFSQPMCVHEVIKFTFDVLGDGDKEYHRPVYRCEKCSQEFVPVWHLDKADGEPKEVRVYGPGFDESIPGLSDARLDYDTLDQAHSYIDSFSKRTDPFDGERCWCGLGRPDAHAQHFPGCLDIRKHQAASEVLLQKLVGVTSAADEPTGSLISYQEGTNKSQSGTSEPTTQRGWRSGAVAVCEKLGHPIYSEGACACDFHGFRSADKASSEHTQS